MRFDEFDFSPGVIEGIKKAGFQDCTRVQELVFQSALDKKNDVTVQSQTGTGKTAAFLLSIFERFERDKEHGHRALIVAPTRELAVQIEQEAELLGSGLPYRTGCFYGGAGYAAQEKKLREGVDIIIGTPGRLIDFSKSGKLRLSDVDTVVIDEADRLFDMGFLPDLRKILRKLGSPEQRQTMLFSATLGLRISELAWEFMREADEIVVNPEGITVKEIQQQLYHVASDQKLPLLLGLLRREEPKNALIFTNTKDMAVRLAKRLRANGFHSEYIMGDLPQKKRLQIIKKIKEGQLDILVATDVAARGLHIDDLEMVFNYDIPEDPENYVHRIGRTARAGKSGKAVTLACEKYVLGLEAVEEFMEMKIPVAWADDELLRSEDKSRHLPHRDRDNRGQKSRSSGSRGDTRGGRRGGSQNGSNKRSDRPASKRPAVPKQRDEKNPRNGRSVDKSRGGAKRPETLAAADPRDKKPNKPSRSQSTTTKGPAPAPKRTQDLEDRLAYYRQKYGEDFQLTDSTQKSKTPSGNTGSGKSRDKSKKKGFLSRLFKG